MKENGRSIISKIIKSNLAAIARTSIALIVLTPVTLAMILTPGYATEDNIKVSTASAKVSEERLVAFATWNTDTEEFVSPVDVGVNLSSEGIRIFVTVESKDTGDILYGRLLADIDDNIFNIDDKKLSSAHLGPIEVPLCSFEQIGEDELCQEVVDTVIVAADWEGIGHIDRTKTLIDTGDDTTRTVQTELVREAKATGSLDGQDLGTAEPPGEFADLHKITTVTKL